MEKSYESMTNKKPNYVKNIVYNIRLEGNLTKMGLSLNNIYQRPYVKPDRQSTVKKREEDEKSSATNAERQQESNQNSQSKGLQYVEQKTTPKYTPAYEQKFNLASSAYSNVNINSSNAQTNANYSPQAVQKINPATQNQIDSKINIAQILKDFIKRLFYVACTAFLLTSCEETYNDKLFWPGELCQEYGSYIKPATLNLTYSGEKLVGKTVDFKTEDSEKGTLTLNDIIPGEKQTPLPISLCEQEDSYTFSGKNVTMGGATVTYSGAITPKTMKLDLDVVIPQNKWKKSYGISNFTKGKKMTVTYSGGQYVWKETNEILTGGFYVHLDDVELTKAGSTLFLRMKLIQNALCYFIPQLLQTITLQPDGNLVANYTTSPVYIGSVPINNIDPDKDVGTIATFVTKFMIGLLTEKDINNALTDRTWTASPINLITWTEESGRLKINLNLPARTVKLLSIQDWFPELWKLLPNPILYN